MYRKRNTPVKEYILPFLQIAVTTIKIKAKTITKITTKITKTLAVTKYIENLILTANLKDIASNICQKENCHSWRYIEEERNKAKEEYKSYFSN